MRTTSIISALLLAALSSAHFVLDYPPSLGFDDDNEPNGPCGGFDINFKGNVTSVTVGGFAVAFRTFHPAAPFLYRATVSKSAPFNWTNLVPVVQESGSGAFCLPHLAAPDSYAGQQGVVQVVMDSPDGVLYQCAAVNFESGDNSNIPSTCTNATTVSATLTTEFTFPNVTVVDNPPSSTSSSSSTSTSHGGAIALAPPFVQAAFIGAGLMALI